MLIVVDLQISIRVMTSSNGNIFRVTGPLCGEFTGPGEFPTQRPVTRSFDVFFDLRLNKRLSKQPWGWWFETPAWSLWRHRNGFADALLPIIRQPISNSRVNFNCQPPTTITHPLDKIAAISQTTFQTHFYEWKVGCVFLFEFHRNLFPG